MDEKNNKSEDEEEIIDEDYDVNNNANFKLQLIYLFLFIIVIVLLITSLIILIRNRDIIMSDPLSYGMKVHNFESCSCIDINRDVWDSYNGGFINKKRLNVGENINWDSKKF